MTSVYRWQPWRAARIVHEHHHHATHITAHEPAAVSFLARSTFGVARPASRLNGWELGE